MAPYGSSSECLSAEILQGTLDRQCSITPGASIRKRTEWFPCWLCRGIAVPNKCIWVCGELLHELHEQCDRTCRSKVGGFSRPTVNILDTLNLFLRNSSDNFLLISATVVPLFSWSLEQWHNPLFIPLNNTCCLTSVSSTLTTALPD